MGLDIADFPCASPEVVWSCVQKNSKYIKGRVIAAGADSHFQASSEVGNLRGYHLPRDTGLRHLVSYDLALGKEEGTIVVTEVHPHSHNPSSATTEHTVPYTSGKSCYEDILKITHEKRPDLDQLVARKLKGLLSIKKASAEEEE